MHKLVKYKKRSAFEYMRKVAQVKVVNTDLSPKWRTLRPRTLTRSGVGRYRWSHRESHGLRRNPSHGETPQPQERPRAKDGDRHRRHGVRGATRQTGSTNENRVKERWRARAGHSKRASSRPSAKSDKDSTKKERGMEGVSDSDWPQTEEHTRDRCRTPEREEHWREPGTLEDSRPQ